jgi:hypothetical protein
MKTIITEDEHRRLVNLLGNAGFFRSRLLGIQETINEIIGDEQNEYVEDVVWRGGGDEALLGCLGIQVEGTDDN